MRHRLHRAFWAAGCLTAALVGCAPHSPRQAAPPLDLEEMRFRANLRALTADDLEGRRPGTPGGQKTVDYLVAQFRKFGLKPGHGDDYVQPVPLLEIHAAADTTLTIDGGRGALLPLRQGTDMVLWTPRTREAAALAHSDLVFVGYGIEAREYHWDDYAGIDVHGKTVLVLAGDPGYGSRNPGVFKGLALSAYGRWSYKIEEAERHGAAAVLLIHDPGTLGFGWNAVRNTWMGGHFELASTAAKADGPALEGWLTGSAGRALFSQAALDYGALVAAAARPGFKAVNMGLTVSGDLHTEVHRLDSPNVIGVVPGSGHRHEYVLYCAHWDGLGRDPGGAVLSGAVADASGVAGLLLLAQTFAHTRPAPDRSIVFVAFTAAEPDLLGSLYYVENPVIPLDQTAGAIDLDALRFGGRTRDVVILGSGNSELEEQVRATALLQGREVRPEPHPEQGLYYSSDDVNFARHGVPALYVKAGIDDAARGPQYGMTQWDEYMAQRYRQAGDKYSEDADVAGAIEDLALYRQVGDRLAATRRFPRWYPDSEFSADHSHAASGD
jgi:Zn-dependent M28 family amino/carboxypeptidase